MRALAISILTFLTALRAEPPEPNELHPRLDPRSNAGFVESAGVQQLHFQALMYSSDLIRDQPLIYFLGLRASTEFELVNAAGKPTTLCTIISKHCNKTERKFIDLIRREKSRREESQALSKSMRSLQARIDLRNSVALNELISQHDTKAEALREHARALWREKATFRESLELYGKLAALRALADPSGDEQRELARLERAASRPTNQDLDDYRAFLRKMIDLNDALIHSCGCESLYHQSLAIYRRAAIKPLTDAEREADRQDQTELARLERQQASLEKFTTFDDLLPADAEAREKFFMEFGKLASVPRSLRFFKAESAAGDVEIAAITGNAVSQSSLGVGVDGPAKLVFRGKEGLQIASLDGLTIHRSEPDWTATYKSHREGYESVFTSPSTTVPAIAMDWGPGFKLGRVDLYLADGVEVDLREFESKSLFIHSYGGGRFILSGTFDRTPNRLRLFGSTLRRGDKPTVISLPGDVRLNADNQVWVSKNYFIVRLDCEVSATLDGDPRQNIDVELRGEMPRLIPVVRKGRPLFDDVKGFIARVKNEQSLASK